MLTVGDLQRRMAKNTPQKVRLENLGMLTELRGFKLSAELRLMSGDVCRLLESLGAFTKRDAKATEAIGVLVKKLRKNPEWMVDAGVVITNGVGVSLEPLKASIELTDGHSILK